MRTHPQSHRGLETFKNWRMELFFRTNAQLAEAARFLSQHHITRVNITNKVFSDQLVTSLRRSGSLWWSMVQDSKITTSPCSCMNHKASRSPVPHGMQKPGDDLIGWAETVANTISQPDICIHWSIKQNYSGAAGKAHASLQRFCDALPATASHDKWPVLLVSGGGAKRQYNTVSALTQIADDPDAATTRSKVGWHVAYNPYIPQVLHRLGVPRASIPRSHGHQ